MTTASRQQTRPTKRILIVDDEPMVADMLKAAFKTFRHEGGYELATAQDGDAAILALMREPFDLVLLDMRMPRMDGLETLKQIHGLGLEVPVIMITGSENTQDATRALSGGIFAYIPKPFDVRHLEHLVALACPSARPAGGGEAPAS